MRNAEYNRARVMKYLVWTFALAWVIQIAAAILINNGNVTVGRLVIAVCMFAPALGVLLSGAAFSGMGWKAQIRKNIKPILIAWLAPIVLTVAGAALYFLIYPGHFDLSGAYMTASAGTKALEQLRSQGMTYPMYMGISVISSVTFSPLLNMFLALGEEIGWRGFLYPQLKAKLGKRKGWILGGIVWGVWHWPLIGLIGYEYGTEYPGFPVVGMLLFCVITVGWGILHDQLYERSGSIWVPALFHGAINAAGTLPLAVCLPNTGSAMLLGPAPMGLLAGLPFLVIATILFVKVPSNLTNHQAWQKKV